MSIIPIGYAQVSIPFHHSAVTRPAYIVYGIELEAPAGTPTELADEQLVCFETAWKATVDSEVTVGPVEVSIGTPDGGLNAVGTDTFVGTQAAAESNLPSTALLVKKITARGGRRGRGRSYIPWVLTDASVTDNGKLGGAALTARQSDADDWLTDLASPLPQPTPMVLLHSESADDVDEPTAPGDPDEVTSLVVDVLTATQRRRLRG